MTKPIAPRPLEYPTAREIAVAIVTAARIHEENPVSVVNGAPIRRSRYVAMLATMAAFPSLTQPELSKFFGFGKFAGNLKLHRAKSWQWWRNDDFERVKAAVTASVAETDAEIRSRVNENVNAIIDPDMIRPTSAEYLNDVREKYDSKPGPVIDAEPIDLPRLLVVSPPKIFDRSIGAPLPKIDQQIEAKTEVEPGLNLFNITDEELLRQPPELVEQLSRKLQARYRMLVAERDLQPKPIFEPKCQQEPAVCNPETLAEPVSEPECKPKSSPAAQAIASFQRARTDTKIARGSSAKPAASPVLVPNRKRYIPIAERVAKVRSAEADAVASRALVFNARPDIALTMRPDAPAAQRGAHVLPPEFFGDPAPGRSALDQRNAALALQQRGAAPARIHASAASADDEDGDDE